MTNWASHFHLGSSLRSISYVSLPGDDVDDGDAIDSVGIGVLFRFDDAGHSAIYWRVQDGASFLEAGANTPANKFSREIDVSNRWRSIMGSPLKFMYLAHHETEYGLQVWAVRLEFQESKSLVIALGDKSLEGVPEYSADNLIVTASREVASSYRPLAAAEPAWAG
jgi:hypothetical protein